jgi:hypothetical protein
MADKITTESGAVYVVDGSLVTGGSKNLRNGRLARPVRMGIPLLIYTPERAHLNPHFTNPAVQSTPVIDIEPIPSKSQVRRLKAQTGGK